jgi:hypothetical protein
LTAAQLVLAVPQRTQNAVDSVAGQSIDRVDVPSRPTPESAVLLARVREAGRAEARAAAARLVAVAELLLVR